MQFPPDCSPGERTYSAPIDIKPKGVSIFRKSKKDRQRNRQKKQNNNVLQSITHKTKHRVIRTPVKIGLNPGAPEGQVVSAVLFFYFTQYITALRVHHPLFYV
jgi:hypothetical protein